MSGKYALIIGNSEYTDSGLAQLTAPGKDAEDFARVLKDKEIGAFDNVNTLLNQPEPVVRGAIDEFFDQKRPDDLLVLYFSGHGVRDELGALFLAVKNTIRSRLRSTAVKSDYIREAMDQSRSKRQVLILDCCNSGAFSQGTKAATGVSIGIASAFDAGYGRIILTASDSTQFAWEGDKVIGDTDSSLFTHFLVEGLEGEADQDGDGRITVDELYDYAYEKVRLATPKQTPSKFSSKEQGEIILRQSTRIENIKPLPLSAELIDEIEDTRPYVREAAVQKLEKILKGRNIGLARSAKEVLVRIAAEDDSRRVSQTATQVLESIRQVEQKTEEERKAREEAERIAMLKAEEERLTREKADAERKAREEIEKLTRAQAEHKAAEAEAARLKAERQAAELAAHDATEKAAREKDEKEAAEREAARLEAEREAAREKADRDAALKAEREAMKIASRKKIERETAERAEREVMELAARRKAEREATETAAAAPAKTAKPPPIFPRKTILKWTIIGIIGLSIIATGAWGISYLASLGAPSPTEVPPAKEPVTDVPTIATERTNTLVPTASKSDETLQRSAIWSNFMSCQKTEPGLLNINSPWLSNEIILDGKISTAQEWLDAVCLDLAMDPSRAGTATLSTRWWFKNDGQWLYLLARVPSVASFGDSAYIDYFWSSCCPWEHSDYSGFGLDGISFDGYGWSDANWSDDILASPPGENSVRGGASGDTTYRWFEFKKALNSGDGYDWNWAPGQTVGTSQTGLFVGIYDSTRGIYSEKSIQLHLGTP